MTSNTGLSPGLIRAVELTGFGLEHLRHVQRREPELQADEVRVRIRAASLNYRDHLVMTGAMETALPVIPLSDGAGDIVELGEGVTRRKIGDRVTTMMTRDWIAGPLTPERQAAQNGGPLDGVLAETIVLPSRAVVPFPQHLDYAEASTLPVAALTAWSALLAGGVKPGDTVLCIGSGGVSLFALQLARLAGARVIVTTGLPIERGAQLRALGADAVIDYITGDWGQAVLDATAGRGVDLVVETGGMQTMPQSLVALRPSGAISFVGLLAGLAEAPDVTFPMIVKTPRLNGIVTGSRDSFEDMNRAIDLHRLRPVIDRRFALSDAADAFHHAMAGRPFGKVVIELP